MVQERNNSLIVIGSGPGIGVHVASLFASKGFTNIALVARNPEKLAKDKEQVEKAVSRKLNVKTYSLDITDLTKLSATLKQIGSDLGTPECIFYNAAVVSRNRVLECDEEDMLYEFKVTNTSLHATARWGIPHLLSLGKADPEAKPSFIITSSLLPAQPDPENFFSLSVVKAAQMNLARSLNLTFGPQGVHVGVIIVGGVVDPSFKMLNPAFIAEQTWGFFDQPKSLHEFSVEILEK